MADVTPVNYYYRQGQKRNVTKVEISGAVNTYIVILSKRKRSPKRQTLKSTKEFLSRNQENNNPILNLDNRSISIVVHKKKSDKEKLRIDHKHRTHFVTTDDYLKILAKNRSTPDVHIDAYNETRRTKRQRSDTYLNASTSFRTQCIINTMTLDPTKVPEEYLALLRHPLVQAQLRIYRHHFNEKKETCYRYCNSMTNLIKTLYDSHKEKHFNQYNVFRFGHQQLEDQYFSKACDLPEIEVRETEDSIFINTFAATAISDQKEELIGVTNLNLLQPKVPIQENYKSCTELSKDQVLIKNELCTNRDMLLAKFQTTTSENLHEIKTDESHKCKQQSERPKALHRAFSFNDISLLEGNAKLLSEGIEILVKEFGHICDKLLITSAKKECYSKNLHNEPIAPMEEKDIHPLSEDNIIKSEKSLIDKMSIEVYKKLTTKKVASEIFQRTGNASILREKSFERREHLHQIFNKHSISLQEFKTPLEKNVFKMTCKDFVILSKNANVAQKEIKAAELGGATILDKSRVGQVVETTSLHNVNSSLKKKEIMANQTDQIIADENNDQRHKLKKKSAAYWVTSLEKIIKPNTQQKQKRGTSIPILMNKKTPRKKHVVEFVEELSISASLKTTPSKAEYAKYQTNVSSANQKSVLKKEEVLKSFQKKGKPLISDSDKSERGVLIEKKDDNTLTKRKKIGKPQSKLAPKNNVSIDTLYSIVKSQVEEEERPRPKSHIDKPQGSRTHLKQENQVENKSFLEEDSFIYDPKSESETSWDKVLTKKIRDVLSVVKDPEVKFRENAVPSLRNPSIKRNTTVQRGKVINALQIKEEKGRPSSPKTHTENKNPKVQLFKQFTSLDGKTALEKEKILRALIKKGKPLPEGRTKAEKALIDRVKTETISKGRSSVTAPTVKIYK